MIKGNFDNEIDKVEELLLELDNLKSCYNQIKKLEAAKEVCNGFKLVSEKIGFTKAYNFTIPEHLASYVFNGLLQIEKNKIYDQKKKLEKLGICAEGWPLD